jgi:TRAP transporter TAXI family solute receptor
MSHHRDCLTVVGVTALVLVGCSGAAPPPPPRAIRIVSAVQGGSPFNRTLASVYAAATPAPALAPEVIKSPGVVESLEMLERDEGDVAYSFTNVVYAGFVGQLAGQAAPYTRLRGIALLQRAALHVLVGPRSPVRVMEDLRGRRLKFSGPGAALVLTVESVLPAFGLDPGQIGPDGTSGPDIAGSELLEGDDAFVVLGIPPAVPVTDAVKAGARLLPLKGQGVDRLLSDDPFYSAMLIPAETYPGLRGPVVTIGVNGVLVCRADLPDDLVYRLTKALYEGPTGVEPSLAQWLEPSSGAATPIPLHPGAARYYRERELGP